MVSKIFPEVHLLQHPSGFRSNKGLINSFLHQRLLREAKRGAEHNGLSSGTEGTWVRISTLVVAIAKLKKGYLFNLV